MAVADTQLVVARDLPAIVVDGFTEAEAHQLKILAQLRTEMRERRVYAQFPLLKFRPGLRRPSSGSCRSCANSVRTRVGFVTSDQKFSRIFDWNKSQNDAVQV